MLDDDYKKILIIRPLFEGMEVDSMNMPVIKAAKIENIRKKKVFLTNFKNLKSVQDRKNTIIDLFNYDDVLKSTWNDPLKYVAKFDGLLAVASPDFSVYPSMNKFELEHNIYKSRWVGALWQSMGITVIPTISWANSDTYDICFSGIEKGAIVIISTIGVTKNKKQFLEGFQEMKKRLEPSLIIVVGNLFDEMEGEFLHFSLTDTFNPRKSYEQLTLFECTHYIKKEKGDVDYGW